MLLEKNKKNSFDRKKQTMASLKDEKVTLTYFHGWGLAEQTRWMLAATVTMTLSCSLGKLRRVFPKVRVSISLIEK